MFESTIMTPKPELAPLYIKQKIGCGACLFTDYTVKTLANQRADLY